MPFPLITISSSASPQSLTHISTTNPWLFPLGNSVWMTLMFWVVGEERSILVLCLLSGYSSGGMWIMYPFFFCPVRSWTGGHETQVSQSVFPRDLHKSALLFFWIVDCKEVAPGLPLAMFFLALGESLLMAGDNDINTQIEVDPRRTERWSKCHDYIIKALFPDTCAKTVSFAYSFCL